MTVADLIHVGGGLKPSADTQIADLTQYEWPNSGQLTGQHQTVSLSAALSGEASANLPLSNGDVLTIRQLPGWNDLGASITVKGEVKHPGTYGIRPGERLSSILQRAGGFQPDGYVFGAVLERAQVRELQTKEQTQLMLRVKDLQNSVAELPENTPGQKQAKENALRQYQNALTQLGTNSPIGRVTIRISPDMNRWKNTAADLEVRAGDILVIPKRPSFVMVTGQVFNPTAVSYRPGKSAKWYLSQSGGPTAVANKKAIFVIRADGSVIGAKESLWSGPSLSAVLQPGDTVVVPEKAIGGGIQWQTVFLATQVAASVVTTIFIALHY
jgi:protein involved in polysaccharide export with SLBB domain